MAVRLMKLPLINHVKLAEGELWSLSTLMEMMFDHYVLEVTWFVCDLYSISSHKPQI